MNHPRDPDFLKINAIFFIGFFLYNLIGMIASNVYEKKELHLIINSWCTPYLDEIFKWITYAGTTYFVVIVYVFLIRKINLRDVIWLASSLVVASSFGRIIKFFFFKDIARPLLELKDKGLYVVAGSEQNFFKTFPSGHTLTAFCFFLFLSTLFKNQWSQIIFTVCAIVIAYSRVYLSQHYLMDTVGGAFIGVFFTSLMYYITRNLKNDFFNNDLLSLLKK